MDLLSAVEVEIKANLLKTGKRAKNLIEFKRLYNASDQKVTETDSQRTNDYMRRIESHIIYLLDRILISSIWFRLLQKNLNLNRIIDSIYILYRIKSIRIESNTIRSIFRNF